MDWNKVIEELDRLADTQYEDSVRNSAMSMYLSSEEQYEQRQKIQDFAFIFRSFANALRKGTSSS